MFKYSVYDSEISWIKRLQGWDRKWHE